MNQQDLFPFIIAAIALLGSPGPAIAALLAVGRSGGWRSGIPFYGGLQLGLAVAAGITSLGLFAALELFPTALFYMSLAATGYLLYLAFKIATSPVGQQSDQVGTRSFSVFGGLFLGVTNPKAYFAFASLFGSFQVVDANVTLDSFSKWLGVVIVMITVDIIWLWVGVALGRLNMSNMAERWMNYLLAAAIIVAAVLAFI